MLDIIDLMFQVTLYPNGDIVFVYIEVQPVLTRAALYDHEPVAGISGDQWEAHFDIVTNEKLGVNHFDQWEDR